MKRILSTAFLLLSFFTFEVNANDRSWETVSYAHYVENVPIGELLEQFASSINVPIVISEKVEGLVNGNFEKAPAKVFIERISKVHSLLWYFDGQALYVYDASEVENDLIQLGDVSPKRLVGILKGLGGLDKRYTLKSIGREGIVMVSGPPRYTQLVNEVADILLSGESFNSQLGERFGVRVFELKHAWADDRTMTVNGRQVLIPGVASTVQSVLGRQTSENITTTIAPRTVSKLKGTGLINQIRPGRNGSEDQADLPQANSGNTANQSSAGYVVANERLNAVIVHDKQSMMPLYEELIKTLDQPRSQIEIEVSIMDVSTDRLDEMGLEWQINHKDSVLTNTDFSAGRLPRETNELSLTIGDGASFLTLLNNTQDLFISRIRALSDQGDASILSQPTVLTLDNTEALIDNSSTFFVRLVGEREVDLFPVTVGSVVRVTPHILDDENNKKVHLDINIEDGQQSGQTVDDIPAISRSIINTEALVNNNGSLLIGGFYFNQESKNVRKIPLLGNLPVLGRLFRSEGTTLQKRARLFLISPRIIRADQLETPYARNVESLRKERNAFFENINERSQIKVDKTNLK